MTQKLLALAVGLFALHGVSQAAVYEVGDTVKDMCWTNVDGKQTCLADVKDTVQVLLYNAGWCGPCNSEFEELVPRVGAYKASKVRFISLSSSGWKTSQAPDKKFLKEWQQKHSIPFVVAGSPKDAGKSFIAPPIYIPNVAIIGKDGKLAFKAVSPGADKILDEVDEALKP